MGAPRRDRHTAVATGAYATGNMVRNARVRQHRSFRNPARHRRARHTPGPAPAPHTAALLVADPDAWGAAAVELGLVVSPTRPAPVVSEDPRVRTLLGPE